MAAIIGSALITTKCKLCLEPKTLQKRSHIIPDFMYQEIYDEKHFLYTRTIAGGRILKGKRSTGEYDNNILCGECDRGVIGQYESYAREVLYGNAADSFRIEVNQHGIVSTRIDLDYSRFKLFLLSVLWRASISKRDFVSEVNLGPHAETIRRMLVDGNAGKCTDYPCALISIRNISNARWEVVGNPIRSRTYNTYTYIFPIAGIYYFFAITRRKLPEQYQLIMDASAVREDGWVKIIHAPNKDVEEVMFRGLLGLKPQRRSGSP